MKKQIITLAVTGLLLSSCGIYTKYEPVTSVPDQLWLYRHDHDRNAFSVLLQRCFARDNPRRISHQAPAYDRTAAPDGEG